ncbi:MFS transporter [Garicola koreensis]|uniref:MFS family permease n=1 Tax=Garicola koreensis TaxID=1262554 RepID=A0A7W5XNX7_9MICC|nr:MFS family permease [Garicola koreensis]
MADSTVKSPETERPLLRTVLTGLCITQIAAWGVLYYAFPVLSAEITADTGWSTSAITAGFSAALVVSALVGIPVGKILDVRGPRMVMTAGSCLAALGLLILSWAPSLPVFVVGWLVVGVAMAGTLYPPAFAAVTRWYGARRVFALTMVTLVGGLASTVFAPLTQALTGYMDWRGVYTVLAVMLAVVTIPVHAVVLRRTWPAAHNTEDPQGDADYSNRILRSGAYICMVLGLGLGSLAAFAGLINLVPMLIERGVSPTTAAWVLGVGGIGQVLGRLFYARLARGTTVRARTVMIFGLLAVTTAALAVDLTHGLLLMGISMLAGTSRGISTLLQATAVTDRWGPRAYGRLSGVMSAPIMLAVAVSPWLGAVTAEQLNSFEAMYLILAGIGVLAAALLGFSIPRTRSPDSSGE